MRISDWSSDVCSSDLIGFDTAPPADAVEIVEQQVGAARTAMQDQGRELEAGEGTEGGGGAGAEIGLSDRPDDPASSEERRVGKECGGTCRSRWSQYHSTKQK